VLAQVGLERLQGHRLGWDAIAQQLADGPVGVAVLVGVVHAQQGAVREADQPRALDLQEEELDVVGDPGYRLGAAGERGLETDPVAVVVGDDLAPLELAAQALAPQFRGHETDVGVRRQIERDQVGGTA